MSNWNIRELFTIKYGSLALLVLQNTFLVVYMGYSRTTSGPMYASSTAVLMMEFVKIVTCVAMITVEQGGIGGMINNINKEVVSVPMELLRASVPSFLYTIQNNLLYFALTHLDAATYQVGYQIKILTTAGRLSFLYFYIYYDKFFFFLILFSFLCYYST